MSSIDKVFSRAYKISDVAIGVDFFIIAVVSALTTYYFFFKPNVLAPIGIFAVVWAVQIGFYNLYKMK